MPLLPVHAGHAGHVTNIDAGKKMGLTSWVRYDPSMVGSESFRLSEYLGLFAERIGESLMAYQSLDGQELLYFQCAVANEEWSRVCNRIREAYLLQKTAYRRANGGAQAPGLTEGSQPRFCQEIDLTFLHERTQADVAAKRHQKVQVRKTFVEVEEEENSDQEELVAVRDCRRPHTVVVSSADSRVRAA